MAIYSVTSANGWYTLELEVSETGYSIPDNTSQITWALRLKSGNASYADWQTTRSATIDGKNVLDVSAVMSIGYHSTVLLGSGTETVVHNPDGKKTINVSGYLATSTAQHYLPGSLQVSGSLVLTDIPRASELGVSDFEIGPNLPITITKKYSAYTHDVRIYDGTKVLVEWLNVPASTTLLVNTAQVDALLVALATLTGKKLRMVLTTRNGATVIGTDTRYPSAYVPASIVPTIGSVSTDETNSKVSPVTTSFLQLMSLIKATANNVLPGQGASIREYLWELDVQKLTTNPATFAAINKTGVLPLKVTVTDSRGRTASSTVNVTLVAYSRPNITKFEPKRFLAGTLNKSGENVRIDLAAAITTVGSNALAYEMKYKRSIDESWSTFKAKTDFSGTSINISVSDLSPSIVIDKNYAYDFLVIVYDRFDQSEKPYKLGSVAIALDVYRRSVWFGQYGDEDIYDAYVGPKGLKAVGPVNSETDIKIAGTSLMPLLQSAPNGYVKLPGGLIIQWGTASVPAGSGQVNVTFPISFPSAINGLFPAVQTSGAYIITMGNQSVSGGTIFLKNHDGGVLSNAQTVKWFAIGV